MAARTLSEVYAGFLSRNWPKMLKALDSGESRIHIYKDVMYKNPDIHLPRQSTAWKDKRENDNIGYVIGYGMCFKAKKKALEWLEENGVGFFPANEDEK